MKTLALFLLALSASAQITPHLGAIARTKPALQIQTAAASEGTVYVASGNISDDLFGQLDTRPGTWGYADSFSVPIVFNPPAGYAVSVLKIEGDLSGMPKHLTPVAIAPNAFAGLLVGFSTDQTGGNPCNLCAANTPQYRQIFVADGQTFHAPFTYDFGQGVLLAADNVLNCIGASYLNSIGLPMHTEITYTFWYSFVPTAQ
jgi:hypothetical protein